ncbi:MAG TPA: hypothetical protein VM733_20415 [Thermoanaerobaculia bacterium]|nr:hypothetical protein [Thermoanaerobaculia bacterium]
MTEPKTVELSEDRVPFEGMGESVDELVEMYGGDVTARREQARDFVLPLRRGGGGAAIECTLSWVPSDERDAVVTLLCNRNVDASRGQRIFLLTAGVLGAILFMLWPFFPHERAWGSLAWLGGIVAIAVYLMTLRKSSGGIAFDFLQRLAERQRNGLSADAAED